MTGSVYLGGGGSDLDEENLWAEAFPSGTTIAIWPFAMTSTEARRNAAAWFSSALDSRGQYAIEEWVLPRDRSRSLSGVDVVAIPGGNTFALLQELRAADLLKPLVTHLKSGGSIYGGSAGAILTGADTNIALAMDANDAEVSDTAGLNLLHGCDVLPHYADDQLHRAQEHSRVTGRPVLCIPEQGGVVVSVEGTALNVGPADASLVMHNKYERRHVGERWTLPGVH